jgi:hypothetical protein
MKTILMITGGDYNLFRHEMRRNKYSVEGYLDARKRNY